MFFRATLLVTFAVCATSGVNVESKAQPYPSRTVTLSVPFPAGGPTDAIARILAEGMRASLGQAIVVKNVPGATGSIASGQVARAEPDGYTLILGTVATHVFNGAAYALDHDVVGDFTPVSLVAFDPQRLVVRKSLPAENLQQLIDWLKANPGKSTAGTAGVGSTAHISAVKFQAITGTSFEFVPYRGLGPAKQDLVAERIDIVFDLAANSASRVRSGDIKGLAVTARTRLAAAPDIPTVDEAGLPGFHFVNWHALWLPRKTPSEIVAKLHAAATHALDDATTLKRLSDLGQQLPSREQQTPQALADYQREEIKSWWPIIKAANMKAE